MALRRCGSARTQRGLIRSAFFPAQFFADVKDAQDKMKKMQENMKKKYSCDRSTTATRLEDLLQDAVVSGRSSDGRTRGRWGFISLDNLWFCLFFISMDNRRRENS